MKPVAVDDNDTDETGRSLHDEEIEDIDELEPAEVDVHLVKEISEVDRIESARRLFKQVSGILNGAWSDHIGPEHLVDIELWSCGTDASFSALCDALSMAVEGQY